MACAGPPVARAEPTPPLAAKSVADAIFNPQPASTILAPGVTSVDLSVNTASNTACRYSTGADLPQTQMQPFQQGAGSTTHFTRIAINPDPKIVTPVFVRCAAQPDFLLKLVYRARAVANGRFPRIGNLWGWGQWRYDAKIPIEQMAKVDLWMGADNRDPAGVAQLAADFYAIRAKNPNAIFLASINAVEPYTTSVPDSYWLRDTAGKKIEVWPGSYRLNLTKPEVADFQARYAYNLIALNGFIHDGLFIDNVYLSQSWYTQDIYGNPVAIDANGDGIADNPTDLDAAWRAGVLREIDLIRSYLPNAIISGHALDIGEPKIGANFNGISFGFGPANVIEGRESFSAVYGRYLDWMTQAKSPHTVMFEGSPINLFAYGYDYEPLTKATPSGVAFARSYYPWMRFALGLTLMNDGYYAYEWGDTWHGNPWWYDEYDVDLGQPLGPAQNALGSVDPGPNLIDNGGFESALDQNWTLWADTATGYAATVTRDTSTSHTGTASARIDVTQAGGEAWRADFYEPNRSYAAGEHYLLTFWAKADRPRPLTLLSSKGSPNWDGYGLSSQVALGTDWHAYSVPYDAPRAAVSDARVQFQTGAVTGTVWLDDIRVERRAPDGLRRDYTNGTVLLNGTNTTQTVALGSGYRRFIGGQAPRLQRIIDDDAPDVNLTSGRWTSETVDSGLWKAAGPFYHAFGTSLHTLDSGVGELRWPLPIDAADTYTVSVWLPAAPAAASWTQAAHYDVLVNDRPVLTQTLSQRTNGDAWQVIGSVPIPAGASAALRLTCSAPCAADAVYLESAGRYNDGAPVRSVTLAPYDAIVLVRAGPPGGATYRTHLPVVRR